MLSQTSPLPLIHVLSIILTKPYRLDLTAASTAYLLEPQWNPMIEEQALCRIHRMGQTKEVRTVRFRIKNSFEEVFLLPSPPCVFLW